MPKPLKLVGKKFCHLTVIKQMPSKNGHTMWLCRCSCGNHTVYIGGSLNYGHYKSCGCSHGLSPKEYIRSKVKIDSKTGCWIWLGSLNRKYGQAKLNNEQWTAHRLSYALFKSPIPKNKIVCHNCPGGDNPLCCNPDHLWLGTNALNSNDMVKKGRSLTGSKNHQSILTEESVKVIKERLKTETNCAKIAKEFNVNRCTISRIKRNRTWSHI